MSGLSGVTHAYSFRPVSGQPNAATLLQVNPGIPVADALSLAECLLCYLRWRFAEAVGSGEPIRGDEAYANELLLELAQALYASTGAHA